MLQSLHSKPRCIANSSHPIARALGSLVLAVAFLAASTSLASQDDDSKPATPTTAPAASDAKPPESDAPSIDLRPKLVKGQERRYDYTVEVTNTQSLGALGDSVEATRQAFGVLLRTTEVSPEGVATIEYVYESMKVELGKPDFRVLFDSTQEKEKNGPADAVFRAALGVIVTLTVDADGIITAIAVPPPPQGVSADLYRTLMSEELVRSLATCALRTGRPSARVGASWKDESTDAAGMTTTGTCTLTGFEDSQATITMQAKVDMPKPPEGMGKLSGGKVEGKILWNTADGCMTSFDSTQTVIFEVALDDQVVTSTSKSRLLGTRK